MSDSPLPDALTTNSALVALVVLILIVVLVGLTGFGGLLAGVWSLVSVAVTAFVLYLLHRFVLAHERIADAQERRARAAERDDRVAAPGTGSTGNAHLDEFGDDDPDPDPGGA
ncbi:hypothetical protein [Halorarum salinum]|uniref:Uncharacterized protein n=1 Tax=Halorarum salinum TaxID=2743089 RepID=A0A7D5L9N7_9EURY|nr:hypothetical protein [Halobaculum salinum]QLG61374.1 hypothetical protein HUG12_06345 [Halobaculum salinum]